ncbi:MAG: FHA domain-containing protein [Chloroflexota bacterium]
MRIVCRTICVWVFFVGLLFPSSLRAQSHDYVTQADCKSAFPNCKIYLSARATESGREPQLAIDGLPVLPLDIQTEATGVVVAFALDEFVPGILRPGVSGQPRYVEFRQSAIDFFELTEQQGTLNHLWLAAYRTGESAPGEDTIRDFPAIINWVSDPQLNAFFNEVSIYETDPNKNAPVTPLYDLTRAIINEIDRSGAPNHFARHLIVYTDGFERIETLGLDEIIRLAQEKNIYIHTVMLGNGPVDFETVLRKIAEPTGGQFVRYQNPAELEPLWSRLMLDVNQTVITFPLPTINAREIQLTVNDQTERVQISLPLLQPPLINIIMPESAMNLDRIAAAEDSPLTEAEPKSIPLQVEITFPDNQGIIEERVRFVEYTIGNITRRQETPPFDRFMLPVDTLDSGEYTIRVRVDDAYTSIAESAPRSIRINVIRPTPIPPTPVPPTATPTVVIPKNPASDSRTEPGGSAELGDDSVAKVSGEAEPPVRVESSTTDSTTNSPTSGAGDSTQLDSENGDTTSIDTEALGNQIGSAEEILQRVNQLWDQAGIYGWVAIAAMILLILLLLFLRIQRRSQTRGGLAFSSDPPLYGDQTEPEDSTEPASEAFPVATLVLVRGEGDLPQSIPLYRQQFEYAQENQWSVGRSYQENETVIDSRRVSKVHATITEQNGRFRIRDEGSSGGTFITSGTTRVRKRLEPLVVTPIYDSDVINFNSIAYRFEVDKGESIFADTEPDLGFETTHRFNSGDRRHDH